MVKILLWECDLSKCDFSQSLFLPLNISTQKSSKNLLCCQKVERVLSGTRRNRVMLKKLSDGESQGDRKAGVLLLLHLTKGSFEKWKGACCVEGVTWFSDQWVSVGSKRGLPRSWVLAPSILNEELQIPHFLPSGSFTVASEEAASVTSAFRGKQLGHSLLLLCKSLLWKLEAKLRRTFWPKRSQIWGLPIDLAMPLAGISAGWVVTGWADSSYLLLCFEIYRKKNTNAVRMKNVASGLVFQMGCLRKKRDCSFPRRS